MPARTWTLPWRRKPITNHFDAFAPHGSGLGGPPNKACHVDSLPQLEALRAQTLLRRLRLESLSRALADVRDAAADEAHAAKLEDARQCLAAGPGR